MTSVQLHGIVMEPVALCRDVPQHRLVPCGGLVALVSDFPDVSDFETLPPEQIADWALAHNTILSAYCGDIGLLPMQIGAIFSDEAAIQAEVCHREATFSASLRALAGLREYTLRLCVTERDPAPAVVCETGRDHLRARHAARGHRQRQETARRAFARDVLAEIDKAATQVMPAGAPKQDRLLDCVFLIPISFVPRLHQIAMERHGAADALGLDLHIVGPWPPYSFDDMALPREVAQDGC